MVADMFTAIAEKVGGVATSERVHDALIDALAEREIKKRKDQIVNALDEQEKLLRERRKLSKPDQVSFDDTGNEVSRSYSKSAVDALRKNKERIEKIDKAVGEALDKGNYDLLNKLGDNKPPSNDEA